MLLSNFHQYPASNLSLPICAQQILIMVKWLWTCYITINLPWSNDPKYLITHRNLKKLNNGNKSNGVKWLFKTKKLYFTTNITYYSINVPIFHINIHFDRIVLINYNYIALISYHCFCRWQLNFKVLEKSHSGVWNLHPYHVPISKQFSRYFPDRCKTRIKNFVIKSI